MKFIKSNMILIIIIILWFIASKSNIWSEYVLPSPQKVLKTFYIETINGNLIKNIYVSLLRVLTGFSIAFILAFVFGMILGTKPHILEGK